MQVRYAAKFGLIVAAFAVVPALCAPTGDFEGTWKSDLASAKLSTKPSIFAIKGGMYSCSSCTPPYKIAADGRPHARVGQDYFDAVSAKVDDANSFTLMTYRKGNVVGTQKIVLSDDGTVLTWNEMSSDNANGTPITNIYKSKRVGPAPAGAHATSGSWVNSIEGAQISDENMTAAISLKGEIFSLSSPTGEHFSAKLGGPRVPIVGDKAGTVAAVVREGNSFKETDYIGGKAVWTGVYTMTDPTTIKLEMLDVKSGRTNEFILKKQ